MTAQCPKMNEERLKVIDNIRAALERGDSFAKVELHDPVITDEDRQRIIYPFDNMRKSPVKRAKAHIARKIAESETKKRNKNTVIVGLENALSVSGGAIITCNHFNIMDNTVVRLLAQKCGRAKKFDIVVQETNIFMEGFFGFLMKNCNTLPVSASAQYMAKNLKPALQQLLSRGDFVLIYPEQEMWFNYKKPRALREGAYHYAHEMGVPVIPCFVEMREGEGYDDDGFLSVSHTLHVMPPIYPDASLSPREARADMQRRDAEAKRACYESVYGISLDDTFIPERDIAGYHK
ncbi:MAG: 1-acyl-sn-glycerol-3-phosphate acyltransferase [Clostridia bacterium]|nr:1-acyl-sn-glycerol-3-phosphate acyltransferase [Clostridia bacterium]